MKYIAHLFALSSLLFFTACGENAATGNAMQAGSSGFSVVADVTELPACSANNDGELVWVKNESSPRMCSGGKWYAVAGGVAASCHTEPLADASGSKIVCGGDSIGVVLNGHNGKDGAQGVPGEKGDKGDVGEQGKRGDTGDDGLDGLNGRNGKDGAPGAAGEDGLDGWDGPPGADGKDGKDGKDGTPGADGKDGADGQDGKDGVNCVLESVDEQTARVICGEDSVVLFVGVPEGEVVLDSEKIAISLDQVSGVTQKGPFLTGSKVLVRELSDGRTLTQTGNSFNGKILNDKGEFRINARMLVSQYVMLEATGYYRNEVTGKNSNSELTLFAITDVNNRNVVNVNLLTHLEYERVIYLVTQKKMRVKDAKKQAQKEIFALIGVDATDFENSEDLSVVGSSEADAALLAFSIILQGDRSESELSELLTKIATDMEKDGTWDDSVTRGALADWALSIEGDRYFFETARIWKIRENVEGWGLSEDVPYFERYVTMFWNREYGLGECSSYDNYREVVAAKRGPSTNRYICTGTTWDVASDDEKDTYLWNDTTDGATRVGEVTGKLYIYRKGDPYGHWYEATEVEKILGGCTEALYGTVRRASGEIYYQCDQEDQYSYWSELSYSYASTFLIIDTQGWKDGSDGDSRWGDSIGVVTSRDRYCYVYDDNVNDYYYNKDSSGWRIGNRSDCDLGMQGCTKARAGLTLRANDGSFYTCSSGYSRVYGRYGYSWIEEKNRSVYNTLGWACADSNDGEMRLGQVNDVYFVCEDSAWRESSIKEETDCRENGVCQLHRCTRGKRGKFEEIDGELKVCDYGYSSYEWRTPNCAETRTQSLCFGEYNSYDYAYGSVEFDSTIVWGCENLGDFVVNYVCMGNHWRTVNSPYDYSVADWNRVKSEYYTQANHPSAVYGEDLVDPRDGEVYKTVIIGGKRWMAENLRYMDYSSANLQGLAMCYPVYEGSYSSSQAEITREIYCERGRHYTVTAAMDVDPKWKNDVPSSLINTPHRGVCPEGWHIPDSTEWEGLLDAAGGFEALQSKGYGVWPSATDVTGFSMLPMGSFWQSWVSYSVHTSYFHGWVTANIGSGDLSQFISATTPFTYPGESAADVAYAVRCVEDDGN